MRRLLRFAFCERLIRPWRFIPGPASTLPVAVILNRFLTDDLVFILGIWVSFRWTAGPGKGRTAVAAGHAHFRPGLADKARGIAAGGGGCKDGILPHPGP